MKEFIEQMMKDAQNGDRNAIELIKGLRQSVLADMKADLSNKEKEEVMKFQSLLNQATAVVKSNANNRLVIAVMSELEQDFKPCMEVMEEAVKRDFDVEGL